MVTLATIGYLTLIALILLLAAVSYVYRGAPRRGAFLMALGVGLGAVSGLTIYPALKITNGGVDDTTFAGEVQQLRAERDVFAVELQQRTRDNEALSKTSAFFNKLHRERLIRIADEIETIKGIVLGPKSGITLDTEAGAIPVTAVVEGAAGFETIISELRALKSLRVRQPGDAVEATLAMLDPHANRDSGTTGVIVDPSVPTPPSGPASLSVSKLAEQAGNAITETTEALRKSLDAKMAAPAYQVMSADDTEIISGRPGSYYVIELKNPKTANRFSFDSGRYTFQTVGPLYTQAFQAFEVDVLRQLSGRVKFELYVRSNADTNAFKGAPELGHEYRTLSYLPSIGGGKYLGNVARLDVPGTLTNAELPNMRGEFLKRLLSEIYKVHPIGVLEGQIVRRDAPTVRGAELVLYVAW